MGTRSIVVVKDKQNNKIIEMYRQFDGYPEGAGVEYKEFCSKFAMVNGLREEQVDRVANGMECFAAQFVAHFKDRPGGYYLHAPTTDYMNKKEYYGMYSAEYYYEITQKENQLHIRCWDCYENKEIKL